MTLIGHLRAAAIFAAAAAAAALHPVAEVSAQEMQGSGAGPFLYVANQEAGFVTVIDLASNQVTEVIDLPALGFGNTPKPHHIAVEPDGSYWYVSLIAADVVLKFNRDNEIVARADFLRPGLLAIDPDSDALWVGRSMAAVNPPQRIGRIERGTMDALEIEEYDVFIPRPHALAISPGGGWVFAGSLAENTVVPVEVGSGRASLSRLEGDMAHVLVQFAISPDGNTMVATGEMSAALLVFDISNPDSPELTHRIDVGNRPWHPSWSADGRWVWFGNLGDSTVSLVDTNDWTVADVISGTGLAQPHGSALSADGKFLYVANRNETGDYGDTPEGETPPGTVVVIDTGTREIVDVIETPPYAAGLGLASGGN